ncbi:hypothetical protein MCEGE10_01779 [Flavobacteriaceae bacterium]
MKALIKILLFSFILLSINCTSKQDDSSITLEQLEAKKTVIENYINSFSCSENLGCNYIAFGSKPCGGPRKYLVFSNTINLQQLQTMVTEYNEMDHLRNIQTNAVSDCSVPLPPNEIGCVNGVCTIIN